MKADTDIEQSKKLVEIRTLESADIGLPKKGGKMKWVMYSLVAISYIFVVLGIMLSGETLGFKFAFSGAFTLLYVFILGFLDSMFKVK